MTGKQKSISLVLGSGGARGLAHIGVIRELEKNGYQISSIVGSSMGALVGGIHAMGRLSEYEQWMRSLDQNTIFRLLDWNFGGGGLVRGESLMKRLRELLGDVRIEDMGTEFTAVAVDIDKGREVWLDKGSLFEAIRASIAIPGVFTPCRYGKLNLVDGGLLNPLPIAPTFRYVSDYVVAVDVNARAATARVLRAESAATASSPLLDQKLSLFQKMTRLIEKKQAGEIRGAAEIMSRSLELMQASMTRHNLSLHEPDLLINIPRDSFRFHEFHKAGAIIEFGAQKARSALDRFQH